MRKQKTTKKAKKSGANPILAFRVNAKTLASFVRKCGGMPKAQDQLRSFMESA